MKILMMITILLGLQVSGLAAGPGRMESSLLCHKSSQLCAVWWNYKSPKASAFWREKRLKDVKMSSTTLKQKDFEAEASFIRGLSNQRKPASLCRSQFLFIDKVSSSKTICEDSLTMLEKEKLKSIFR